MSCERKAASCPTPQCTHPARHRGECCATCNGRCQKYASSFLYISTFTETTNQLFVFVPPECEYEQRVYADGEMFSPPGGGPCLQCRCKASLCSIHPKKSVCLVQKLFFPSRGGMILVSCIFLF